MEDVKMLSSRIKTLRIESGLTQKELAKILKVSESSIGMIEQGRRGLNDELKMRFCQYFNISMDYLMGLTASETLKGGENMNTEELLQSFTFTIKTLLQEQQKTNQLLEKMAEADTVINTEKLLTPKEVQERYNLPEGAVYKMFNDKEFPALRYTKPMKATTTAINEYLSKRHEKME